MIEDIVNVLQGIQPDVMPMFAVYDLSRLPPLDLNSVDVTNMTQDIRNIRKDMSHSVAEQGKIDQLQDQLQKVMNQMDIMSQQMSEVVKVVQSQKDNKVLYSDVINKTRPKDDTNSKGTLFSFSPVRRQTTPITVIPSSPKLNVKVGESTKDAVVKKPRCQDKPNPASTEDKDKEWREVPPRRKKKTQVVVGKSCNTSRKLISARPGRYVSLFISRLSPDDEVEDVQTYIKDEFGIDLKCEKLKTKFNDYSSFKAEGFCENLNVFYDADRWPENVLVRRYFTKRQ